MKVGGREIQVDGGLLRIARLGVDQWESVDDPEAMRRALRESGIRIDLFTFMQTLPDTSPKYPYALEWDNVAALPISTFDQWWAKQINDKTRNVVRLAERKGIAVREVPFDDVLVAGISAVYNESPDPAGETLLALWEGRADGAQGERDLCRSQHLPRRVSRAAAGRFRQAGVR